MKGAVFHSYDVKKGMAIQQMETIYRTAAEPWDLSGNLGNHCVVVTVPEPGEYVKIRVHWRRWDLFPERCGILAHSMADDRAVKDALI